MKKTYIQPSVLSADVVFSGMIATSPGHNTEIDSGKTVTSEGDDPSGGWTRQQIWTEEE